MSSLFKTPKKIRYQAGLITDFEELLFMGSHYQAGWSASYQEEAEQ
jgi:hypothetical protein